MQAALPLAALLAMTLAQPGLATPTPAGRGGTVTAGPAARAVMELTATPAPRSPLGALPAGFEAVMGYRPATSRLADGTVRAMEPGGACSSPLGGTRFGFTAVCAAHDVGYDLLRYAGRTGEPLGPEARRRLDRMLERDLHAHCRATQRGAALWSCHALAALYAKGAQLNSWWQGHGVP